MSATESSVLPVVAEVKAAEIPATRDVLSTIPLEIKIHDHGFVRLVDCMPRIVPVKSIGVESRIIDAARVSYGGGTKSVREDVELLSYLFRHGHLTPFEMVEFAFIARTQMFVAKQMMRHRTASYNEESARYSIIGDITYCPTPDEIRAQSTTNRQGSSAKPLSAEQAETFSKIVQANAADAFEAYNAGVKSGVAREMARIVLPEGRYTSFYFKMNLRNLLHFLELRMDSHAQKEMQDFANAVYELVKSVAPHAIEMFNVYMRDAIKLSRHEVEAISHLLPRSGLIPANLGGKASAGEKTEWSEKLKTICARGT